MVLSWPYKSRDMFRNYQSSMMEAFCENNSEAATRGVLSEKVFIEHLYKIASDNYYIASESCVWI